MAPARVVFLGNDAWSVPTLAALAASPDADVVLAVTNPPRPAGRGSALRPTPVAVEAHRLGIALDEVDTLRDPRALERLRSLAPDVLVVVAYGELLDPDVLAVPRHGSLNVHFSLLPRWRGASPVQHAILAGDRATGVTVMRMERGLDTGPVFGARVVDVGPSEDAGSLGARLAAVGAELLVGTVRPVVAGDAVAVPQEGEPTFAPKLGPGDRTLAWDRPAAELVRRVRAFAPEPGATTSWRGAALKVVRAEVAEGMDAPAGTIAWSPVDGVRVAAAEGAVRLLEVAPAGRRRMAGVDWARGARPAPGERVGG